MAMTGIGEHYGVYRNALSYQKLDDSIQNAKHGIPSPKAGVSSKAGSPPPMEISAPKVDTVEISGDSDKPRGSRKQFPQMWEKASEEPESSIRKGAIAINAAKLARKLAAAKTQSQVRAIIAEIQADLRECESGKAQGMEIDEASVAAAERLLQEAQQRMGETENREPTPEERMASALASLF